METYDLGVDIGGSFIKYAWVDSRYNIIERWRVPASKFETKDEFYDYLCVNARDMARVRTIGISAPGLIDKDSNVRSHAAPNVQVMFGTNINEEVRKRTDKQVAAINDAKSAGLCELKIGNAKGTNSSAFLIIGTGTGGCLCDKEDVVYGKDGFAGEFHHLPFINFLRNTIDRQGNYSSMTALLKIYNSKVGREDKLHDGVEITKKYLSGSRAAKAAVDEWSSNMAVQLLTIAVFYNPEVICLGGGISQEPWFITLIREKFTNVSRIYFGGTAPVSTEIRPCKYSGDANVLGAVMKANSIQLPNRL